MTLPDQNICVKPVFYFFGSSSVSWVWIPITMFPLEYINCIKLHIKENQNELGIN